MPLIDNGIYRDGVRTHSPEDLRRTYDALDGAGSGAMAWIGLYRPSDAELASVADEFGLHPLAVEDASKGHQRAKLERYGDTLFVVLRPAWYDDDEETVEFGEVHLFTGRDFVVTVRHAERPDLADVRRRLETDPEALARGSEAVLCAVLDEVVDSYGPVIAGLQDDIDEIEDDLFDGDVDPESSKRIYQLLSEVIGFQRAIGPLPGMLTALLRGAGKYGTDVEVQNQLRNVMDHALRITERADTFRALLENALTLHSTLVTQEQNDAMRRMTSASLAQGEESRRLAKASMDQGEEVKKISSWAAILFAPTLVASIYGMNFDHMPELHWVLGYPFAIALMLALGVVLWVVFKKRNWL
ncbi:magnesium and cobalt transport protein CorA [Curtobacterium sp. MCBD17_032]|uniref:magnesium and cobalt transport protein CorA n=1 Tax=Curtobacterium sp. MCBD17_032 TaxID=2175659 RepID=UPI000DAAB9EF|nr:magnesium and cobalt transport protein CorA [Curtobacterium sp. MCBD17_032]PZE86330.1 transporter [Curtobacterium sp. MCBD17_032]